MSREETPEETRDRGGMMRVTQPGNKPGWNLPTLYKKYTRSSIQCGFEKLHNSCGPLQLGDPRLLIILKGIFLIIQIHPKPKLSENADHAWQLLH
jgi:hypothetical protein